MKNRITLLLFLGCFGIIQAQEKTVFDSHQISADFGSFRNRYLYPITNIRYESTILEKVNLKFSARLRSYGTLYFFSKTSYDITPIIEYYLSKTPKPIYFSAGVGLDARLRLSNDSRSEATNSVEPFLSLSINGNKGKFNYKLPLWTRFYSNGIALTILPECSLQLKKDFGILLRYELSYLAVYKVQTHEWRQDIFIGVSKLF